MVKSPLRQPSGWLTVAPWSFCVSFMCCSVNTMNPTQSYSPFLDSLSLDAFMLLHYLLCTRSQLLHEGDMLVRKLLLKRCVGRRFEVLWKDPASTSLEAHWGLKVWRQISSSPYEPCYTWALRAVSLRNLSPILPSSFSRGCEVLGVLCADPAGPEDGIRWGYPSRALPSAREEEG